MNDYYLVADELVIVDDYRRRSPKNEFDEEAVEEEPVESVEQ